MKSKRTNLDSASSMKRRLLTLTFSLIVAAGALVAAKPLHGQTYDVLYDITSGYPDEGPEIGVVLNGNGVFGTISLGGLNGYCCGRVFELSPNGQQWTFAILHYFNGSPDGLGPSAIAFAADGSIYGTTFYGPIGPTAMHGCGDFGLGCGTVFKLEKSQRYSGGWDATVIYRFGEGDRAAYDSNDLAIDRDGNVFGIAGGGQYSGGVVYQLARSENGWIHSFIHEFKLLDADGFRPAGGLTIDENGVLYGATAAGGNFSPECTNYGCGTVFELLPSADGWTEKVLYRFSGRDDGAVPEGGVVLGAAGNLYGTTSTGGIGGFGTVFKLSAGDAGWNLTTLHDLGNGAPRKISIDAAGDLYGYNRFGSDFTVYKLAPSEEGWTYTDLHLFSCDTGCWPVGKLAVDANGNLYGMTSEGGLYGYGTVFKITPN